MRKDNNLFKVTVCSLVTGLLICLLAIGCIEKASADTKQFIAIEPVPVKPIPTIEPIKSEPTPTPTPVPEFNTIRCKLSAYCVENYPHICNNGNASTTATGTKPTPGRTVAVDPRVIPYFSKVIIYGHTYIAEDCGGAIKGNRVDIAFATHREALEFGIRYADVQWVK